MGAVSGKVETLLGQRERMSFVTFVSGKVDLGFPFQGTEPRGRVNGSTYRLRDDRYHRLVMHFSTHDSGRSRALKISRFENFVSG